MSPFSPYRSWFVRPFRAGVDLAMMALALVAAYAVRFDFALATVSHSLLSQLPLVLVIQWLSLRAAGVHRLVWRYIGLADVVPFVRAAVWSSLPLLILRFALPDGASEWRIPLSVILLDAVLAFGLLLGVRVLRRVRYEEEERRRRSKSTRDRLPVLLIGAGRLGVLAAKEIRNRGDSGMMVAGFIDDDPSKAATKIEGVPVLGTSREIPELVRQHGIDHVIVTVRQIERGELRRILAICEQTPVRVKIIPALYEVLQGQIEISGIRDVEIDDLLGRQAVDLDTESLGDWLEGKCVLVTGAGGSIGSELCRQVCRFKPARLVAVERAEGALFEIDRELREANPGLVVDARVCDIRIEEAILPLLEEVKPRVVLHAAAHKHVPLMEKSESEAVRNNVFGTLGLGRLCGRLGVESFVLISTDKAVRPTSVMGASKRIAELVIQDLDRRFDTKFLAVRFGNVLGSSGSVVPIFRRQIAEGGPVRVTHPEVSRYFMTTAEAAQLVLQAAVLGQGGEILVLDMGDPVRIVDLARDMIRLAGLKPYEDIDIVYTGLRPGEKMFEELHLDNERTRATRHAKIHIGLLQGYSEERMDFALRRLDELVSEGDADTLRAFISELLPESSLTPRSIVRSDDLEKGDRERLGS